jgi:demethylmenaquinone methyltransferase/2-methoxy-6-polyprenyl-1,4-benzoquinol methylase
VLANRRFYCDNGSFALSAFIRYIRVHPRPLAASEFQAARMTVDKSGPRVRRMFGEIAGRYDLLNHLLSLNIDRYWRRRTVKLVPPRPGMRILDVCTGTGDLALAYHLASRGQASILAADFTHEMLAIGRRKAERAGVETPRLAFVEADAMALPLPSDQFDIVCVAFGLRNVADTDAGLAEMARVCAPGGRVAVLEFSTPQWQPFKGLYGWYFRNVLPRIGQMIARNRESAYSYLPESVGDFPQGEALAAKMRAAGLIDIAFRGLTLGVATIYVGTKPPVPLP